MNAAALDTPLSDDERIVAALLARGRLKEADLGRARRLQDETGGDLLSLLSRLGLVSERDHAFVVGKRGVERGSVHGSLLEGPDFIRCQVAPA